MLTQKGREPFIRMKLFLDDENAVHKLVASQYKIAPDKLMRTGNYGGSRKYLSERKAGEPVFERTETSFRVPNVTDLIFYVVPVQIPPKQLTKVPDFHHSLHDVLPASFR